MRADKLTVAQKISEQGAVYGSGEMLPQEEPERVPELRITAGMGERDGAGDDLAASVALAVAERTAVVVKLTASGELVIGWRSLRHGAPVYYTILLFKDGRVCGRQQQ
jgi:hypothetical protein